jgi:hypothetical protein
MEVKNGAKLIGMQSECADICLVKKGEMKMNFKNYLKELMCKIVSIVLVVSLLAGVAAIPQKTSKAAKKIYLDDLILEQGTSWVYYAIHSWTSSNMQVAVADMYDCIYGMKVGKAKLIGKDSSNNKYVLKVTVIKPINFQVKRVQTTKKTLKFTIKNLTQKAVKIQKKARYYLYDDDATVSYDCKLKQEVTIQPGKTETIVTNISKEPYFTSKGKRAVRNLCMNIVYDKQKLQYDLSTKAVKNTRTNKTELYNSYIMNKGEKGNICLANNTEKVTWSVLSGKKVVTILRKTNHFIVVKAKGVGKAKIQAKIGKKKYKCTVEVM